jgi:hypothetical protein
MLVHLTESIEHRAASFDGDAVRVVDEQNRICAGAQSNSRVLAGKKARAPETRRDRLHIGFGMKVLGLQHNEGGQVLIHAAQSVVDPGTDAGASRDHESSLEEGDRRFVIDRVGIHAADDGDVVSHLGDVWQQF